LQKRDVGCQLPASSIVEKRHYRTNEKRYWPTSSLFVVLRLRFWRIWRDVPLLAGANMLGRATTMNWAIG
jgi:hypothetical protein